MASSGRVAATTEEVALIRSGAYDVVRVGRPPRTEFATWRYGERIKARERERLKIIVPVSIVVVGGLVAFNAAVGGSMGAFVGQIPGMVNSIYTGIVGNRVVRGIEPPVCDRCGSVMTLKAKHIAHARLTHTAHADLVLLLSCPRCKSYGAQIEGPDAVQALRTGLVYTNLRKGKRLKKLAETAARSVDRFGGPEGFVRSTTRIEKTVRALEPSDALALEIAVDEQAEVRELERQWREAEELANIADNLLVDPAVEERVNRMRKGDTPPPG